MENTMHAMLAKFLGWLACLAAVTMVGCSRGPELVEVSGTIRVDGKPMHKAMVEFVPESPHSGQQSGSIGFTDEQGKYSLATYENARGALAGSHRIVIVDLISYPSTEPSAPKGVEVIPPKPRISDRYRDVMKTPLRKEVSSGQGQTIDLELNSRAT